MAAGTPARVGKLTVTGDPALTSARGSGDLQAAAGSAGARDALQRAVARLRKRYVQPAPAGGATDGGRAGLPPGEQHGGLQHRGGAAGRWWTFAWRACS